MPLRVGIIGLPNAGKSTLLNALAHAGAAVAPYPFTTIAPNVGVVPVSDLRLAAIAGVTHPQRVVPATVEFVDIAGLVRGAHQGEGLGNQFLAQIREVDALAHVVRVFTAADVPVVEVTIDPTRDAEIVETELLLADLATVERVRERLIPRARAGDRAAKDEVEAAERFREALQRGIAARRVLADAPEAAAHVSEWHLLTAKPVVYVANTNGAADEIHEHLRTLAGHAAAQDAAVVSVNGRWEAELAELEGEEAKEFRALGESGAAEAGPTEVGAPEAGAGGEPLPRFVQAAYALLGLLTFFSVVSAEVRAWPVPRGTTAVDAAAQIHSDMAEGFIRAEVIGWETLVAAGSLAAARERGLLRLEGRAYQVQDGDVITFRFAA